MLQRCFYTALLFLIFLCTCAPSPENRGGKEEISEAEMPNILFILTDDQGIGDLSLHGNDSIRTPNIDALLTSGARFNRFYVSPVCAPTRASFLSGLHAPRTGAVFVTRRRETMTDKVLTIPEYMRHAGYRTGLFGKWHNGATAPYDPGSQGFEEFLGFTLGHFNDYFNGELQNEHNELIPFSGDLTQILTDTAANFMMQEHRDPFFCMLTYQAPHTPVQVADKYWDAVKTRGLSDYNTGIYAMIESVDDRIGQLLDRLGKAGKLDNTIVIFSTDNGPNGDRYRMGLKGTKGQVDEGAVRVPFGIRFPGNHPANGQIFSAPAAHIDLVPTLLDIVDLPVPENLDGQSLMPLLQPDSATTFDPNRSIYAFKQGYDFTGYPGSVRNSHRLVVMNAADDFEAYEIHKDEGQRTDIMKLKGDYLKGIQGKARKMADEYNQLVSTIARPDRVGPPIDLDAARGKPVRLLAHEGEPNGACKFSDQYGWANDWFVMSGAEGYVTWPVKARKDHKYRATVRYHNGADENRMIVFTVDNGDKFPCTLPPFNTRQLPVADRVKRKEVYPRAWGEQTVEIMLPSGAKGLSVYAQKGGDVWIKEITLQ